MSTPADRPQIGPLDVEAEVIDAPGELLAVLLEKLDVGLPADSVDGTPAGGWRVLSSHDNRSLTLGAPLDAKRQSWRIAYVQGFADSDSRRTASIHPDLQPLRPSRAERSRGLVLRWPAFSAEMADSDMFVIDIVNTAETPWLPQGDHFQVVGVITAPGEEKLSFGWFTAGGDLPALPLGPGEYARTRVRIGDEQWRGLRPGPYDLHGVLASLGARSESPLRLDVTAEQIRRRSGRSRGGITPEQERRHLDQERVYLETLVAARPHLARIAAVAARVPTLDELRDAVQDIVGGDPSAAGSLLNASLFQFTDEEINRARRRLNDRESRLSTPEGTPGRP